MISILCPSRGRADGFRAMRDSALSYADAPSDVQIICYLDYDDPARLDYVDGCVYQIVGPRIVLSEAWNRCAEQAAADILMHCGDDIRFRTHGWDTLVENTFADYADRIVFVHGDDLLQPDGRIGTHGFLHRRWVETVGYFVPPYFVSDYNDMWLTEVADQLGRRVYLPQLVTEHMHPDAKKGPLDQTHLERLARHGRERPDVLYAELAHERAHDVEKLREAIAQVAA